jgi:transcriptional regulator with PAS, ATPase and Fis domain
VLINGESGTGKELLARFVHHASSRSSKPFVALNCAALPRDLQEAELFGIDRGVATGVEGRRGKFELAHGGTLFLDEIGDMALETQAMILRVLEEGVVYRIGSSEARPSEVRIVAATNKDVSRLREGGGFRSDLFFRIATWQARVPALRERRADIQNLAAHFLALEAKKAKKWVRGISEAAARALLEYDWPGNVRQLENEMARAVAFVVDGGLLESSRLSPEILAGPTMTRRCSLTERMRSFEGLEILRALGAHEWDTAAAAEALGISRSTLYRRIRSLGIEAPSNGVAVSLPSRE